MPARKHIWQTKKATVQRTATIVAGAVGFEPTTNGFGDHYSTVEPYPYNEVNFIMIINHCQQIIKINIL